MLYRIVNTRTGRELASKALVADTFFRRTRGLLGKSGLGDGEALIIRPCRSVHMMFMTFPIDVVFCDAGNGVLSFQTNLKPWRISRHESMAQSVIELPAGTCSREQLAVDDVLEIHAVERRA